MKGLNNLGATCWLNALIQCLRVCKNWEESPEHKSAFYKLVRGETDDTTQFLEEFPKMHFGNSPSDSQEALLHILDKLDLKEFVGEVTQTIVYPGGRSVSKTPCTVWFGQGQKKPDVISDYVDETGKVHNVAVIQRELTKVPEVLVSDVVENELFGKPLIGCVIWGFGHYVAYVKEAGDWWYVNDQHAHIKVENAILPKGVYLAFYGVGKTYTPRTHFEEA